MSGLWVLHRGMGFGRCGEKPEILCATLWNMEEHHPPRRILPPQARESRERTCQMTQYFNHSGGCPGSDMEWENQGLPYGVKTNAYSFGNHVQKSKNQCKLTLEELKEGATQAQKASLTLMRPWKYIEDKPYVKNLISRNWFQVKNADCVYAIGTFVKNSKQLVNGGTGWAVQMAVDNHVPVFLFEQEMNSWFLRGSSDKEFVKFECTPPLTPNFAGIGTREINANGKAAIGEVYKQTFS
jgi:hypothetical protein